MPLGSGGTPEVHVVGQRLNERTAGAQIDGDVQPRNRAHTIDWSPAW